MKVYFSSSFKLVAAFSVCLLLSGGTILQAAGDSETPDKPLKANLSYGPSPHQILDIYLPPTGAGPFPVMINYGLIWKPGKNAPTKPFLAAQIAVVAVETRTMNDAVAEKAAVPVSYPLLDARRALQFIRGHAAEFNLDPNRIATRGSSQGSLLALYVGCAGEKADPTSADPVERVSTRVTCIGAAISQPSIDPKQMQEWVPGVEWGFPAFGCSFADSLKNRDKYLPVINTWSPDALVNKDSPPIFFEYTHGPYIPGVTKLDGKKMMEYLVHDPRWALGFQKLAESRGATVYVDYPGHPCPQFQNSTDFIIKQLKP
jgi:hypothetical protein